MHDLTVFQETHIRLAQADALIDLAATVRDWRLLEDAVDAKIAEQQALVAWWDENVRGKGRPKNTAERAVISQRDAEDRSGFSNQQLSRWQSAG